jgi:hypothetical protein
MSASEICNYNRAINSSALMLGSKRNPLHYEGFYAGRALVGNYVGAYYIMYQQHGFRVHVSGLDS